MLHFRVTPKQERAIRARAENLSEYLRQAALDRVIGERTRELALKMPEANARQVAIRELR